MSFRRAMRRDGIADGALVGVTVGKLPVVLAGVGDAVCAFEDWCAHQRVPLSDGLLKDGVLMCAGHGWCFDAITGAGINPTGTALRRLQVRVEDGDILVDVGEEP